MHLRYSDEYFYQTRKKGAPLGDYSIAGMEELCVVERKELSDLVHSCTTDRAMFINRMRRMASYLHFKPDMPLICTKGTAG